MAGAWCGVVTGRSRRGIDAGDFALDLVLTPTQPVLPQGRGGYSQKGPAAAEASHYYSIPQLKVSGSIVRDGVREAVSGKGWLDREWSSTTIRGRARPCPKRPAHPFPHDAAAHLQLRRQ